MTTNAPAPKAIARRRAPKDAPIAATEPRREPTVMDLMQAVIDNPDKLTPETVGVMKEMMILNREIGKDQARKDFAVAFKALQSETKAVQASKHIPRSGGGGGFSIAPFEEIMEEVQPHLDRHGFTLCFDIEYADNPLRIIAIAKLMHIHGHEQLTRAPVRMSKPPGANDSQADGATITYAKRYALCAALNIRIDHDTDARGLGDVISPEQAADLERRCKAVAGTDATKLARMLKVTGATTFSEIHSGKVGILEDALAREERNQPRSQTTGTTAPSQTAPAPQTVIEPPVCGFRDAGDLRSAVVEKLVERSFTKERATKVVDWVITQPPLNATSYLDKAFTEESRTLLWSYAARGELDRFREPAKK